MNGRAHMLMGGAAAAPMLLLTQDGWALTGYAAVAVAASLAPDVDHSQDSLAITWPKRAGWLLTGRTRSGRKKPPSPPVRFVFFFVLLGLMRGLSKAVRAASKKARAATGTPGDRAAWARVFDPDHRGLTHTGAAAIVAGVLCGGAAELLGGNPLVGVAVFSGWMSHLLSDACTTYGVPLLWPVRRKSWRKIEIAGEEEWVQVERRWHPFRLLRRLNLKSCAATDWRVAWLVVALIVTPTASLYSLVS